MIKIVVNEIHGLFSETFLQSHIIDVIVWHAFLKNFF